MSGGEKKKLQRDEWMKRRPFNPRLDFLMLDFNDIDKGFVECEAILSRVNLNIGFESKANLIGRVIEKTGNLLQYIDGLPMDLDSIIDEPLKRNFNMHATESISRIHADDISTDNTIGIKKPSNGQVSTSYNPYGVTEASTTYDNYNTQTQEVEVKKISFEDFMDENTTGGEYRKKFSDLFKADYNDLTNKKAFGKDSGVKSYDGYVDFLAKQGEFDHKMNQPFKQFISGLLDLTIVKPLIEMSTGTDMITNEDLTETEKLYKGIGAIVDVATLGYAFAARKLVEGGVVSAVRLLGVGALSNAAAYTAGYVGNELGLPLPLILILSLGLGVTVGKLGSKFVVTSKSGVKVGEILDDATGDKSLATNVKSVLETGDAKAVETALGTFDLKTMSKEDIKELYNGLSKSGLKKAEIQQYQKLLLKNAEVPEDVIKGIVKPEISAIDKAAQETKAIEAAKDIEIAKTAKIAKAAKVAEEARVDEIARIEKVDIDVDTKETAVVTKGTGDAEVRLSPKFKKYVSDSFNGKSKKLQNNFNRYLRENVWSDESLSNTEKIKIMKANFDKLTPEQKVNFNVLSDARVIENSDYSNWGEWPTVNWPSFPGLDVSKEISGISKKNIITQNLDRIGSLSGNNFGIVSEDGHIYTQAERSICYIDNKYAYNSYSYFDNEHYIESIDCIKNSDYEMLNKVIDDINLKNGTKIKYVDKDIVNVWNKEYLKFQTNEELKVLAVSKNVDSTYGVIGKASPWKTADGEVITSGGAPQLNTPVSGQTLKILGILR